MESRATRRIRGRGGSQVPVKGAGDAGSDVSRGPSLPLQLLVSIAIHLVVLGSMGYLPGLLSKTKSVKMYTITMTSLPGPAGGGGSATEAVKPPPEAKKEKPTEKKEEKDEVKVAKKTVTPPEKDKAVEKRPEPKKPGPKKPEPEQEPETRRPEAPAGPGVGPAGGGAPEGVMQGPVSVEGGVEFPFSYYLAALQKKIGGRWPNRKVSSRVPPSATVFFRIDRKGRITDVSIEESSGIGIFDRDALRAVTDSNPLPPLPDGFEGKTLGVHYTFVSKE